MKIEPLAPRQKRPIVETTSVIVENSNSRTHFATAAPQCWPRQPPGMIHLAIGAATIRSASEWCR